MNNYSIKNLKVTNFLQICFEQFCEFRPWVFGHPIEFSGARVGFETLCVYNLNVVILTN